MCKTAQSLGFWRVTAFSEVSILSSSKADKWATENKSVKSTPAARDWSCCREEFVWDNDGYTHTYTTCSADLRLASCIWTCSPQWFQRGHKQHQVKQNAGQNLGQAFPTGACCEWYHSTKYKKTLNCTPHIPQHVQTTGQSVISHVKAPFNQKTFYHKVG